MRQRTSRLPSHLAYLFDVDLQDLVPSTCNAVEALLRARIIESPSRLAQLTSRSLGCTSSHTVRFMCWKEVFPNDAACFDLVDELYAIPHALLPFWDSKNAMCGQR